MSEMATTRTRSQTTRSASRRSTTRRGAHEEHTVEQTAAAEAASRAEAEALQTAAEADERVAEAMAEVPKKSRLERQADKGQESYEKLVRAWLDGEQVAIKLWLDAEAAHVKAVKAWLDGEQRYGTAQGLYDTVRVSAQGAAKHFMMGQSLLDDMLAALAKIKDGGYFKDLGFEKYVDFLSHICKTYVGQLDGGSKKVVARFVVGQIPGLTQRKYEEVTGIPQPQISRAVNDSNAGSGDQGHGGARERKGEAAKLEDALNKSLKPAGKPNPLENDDKWTDSQLKQAEMDLWAKIIDVRRELHHRGLPLAKLTEPEYGTARSGTQGSVGGKTDTGRQQQPAA
jgi:hypothetical protein